MGPLPSNLSSSELFRQPLIEMLNAKHPLVKLADVIDWPTIDGDRRQGISQRRD